MLPTKTSFITLANSEMEIRVLGNPNIVTRFPFLLAAKTKKDAVANCPPCQAGAKGEEYKAALNTAREQIAQLPATELTVLKEMLGVSQIRVFVLQQHGSRRARKRIEL